MGDASSTELLGGKRSTSELPSLFDKPQDSSSAKKTQKEKEQARADLLSGKSSSFGESISPSGQTGEGPSGGSSFGGGSSGGSSFGGAGIGGTIISSFGEIEKGIAQRDALKEQAKQFEIESRQAALRGTIAATNESIRANRAIGSQIVGSSTSLTGSSAGAILSESEGARSNINIIKLDAAQRELLLRDAARKARQKAKQAEKAGFLRAGGQIAGSFF